MRVGGTILSEFRTALRDLRVAQKSSSGAAAYSRFVNRPLGRPLAALAYTVGMTPTQVTLVSGAVTFTGIACIAIIPPSFLSAVLVAALLMLGYALDSADGQLARLSGTSSTAGEWLDHLVDATKTPAVHIAVLICWFRFFELQTPWLLIPLFFSIIASVFFFGFISTDLLRRVHGQSKPVTDSSGSDRWRSHPLYALAVLPTDYGMLCLSFVLLGWRNAHVVVYSALAAFTALYLILAAVRWFRSMRRLENTLD